MLLFFRDSSFTFYLPPRIAIKFVSFRRRRRCHRISFFCSFHLLHCITMSEEERMDHGCRVGWTWTRKAALLLCHGHLMMYHNARKKNRIALPPPRRRRGGALIKRPLKEHSFLAEVSLDWYVRKGAKEGQQLFWIALSSYSARGDINSAPPLLRLLPFWTDVRDGVSRRRRIQLRRIKIAVFTGRICGGQSTYISLLS